MDNTTLAARMQQLHHVESDWTKINNTFIPKAGEFIIYDPDTAHPYVRYKVGDGKTKLKDLPFSNYDVFGQAVQYNSIMDIGMLDSGEITAYKTSES